MGLPHGVAMNSNPLIREAKRALRSILPMPILNWRETRYYGRFGEVELHLVRHLCRPDQDSIDVGANDGCYIHFMRKHSRCVHAFEPIPSMAKWLARRFKRDVVVREIALSRSTGTAVLRMPLVGETLVSGCSTISEEASSQYSAHQEIHVRIDTLDNAFDGDAGFIKIDVEGHEEAVLDGARQTIARCRPRVLVEILERLAPGGIQRITAFFQEFAYRGYFVYQRSILPIDRFDPDMMQRPENLPDLTATLDQRERFGAYIYNFIFLPDAQPATVLHEMEAEIASL
jgi:FkbM family methyltransferase